jgi:hypothetical protein
MTTRTRIFAAVAALALIAGVIAADDGAGGRRGLVISGGATRYIVDSCRFLPA